jgi:hypothetical protein
MGRWDVTPLLFRLQNFEKGEEVMGKSSSRHNCHKYCAECHFDALTGETKTCEL